MHLYHLLAASASPNSSVRFTKFEATITLLGLLLSLVASLFVAMGWIYKRGAGTQEQISATADNTKATKELTASFGKFADKTGDQISGLEHRLTVIEVHSQLAGLLAASTDTAVKNLGTRVDDRIKYSDMAMSEFDSGQERQDKSIETLEIENSHSTKEE